MIRPNEHQVQCSLMRQVELQVNRYPELRKIFAVPNGEKRDHRTVVRKDGTAYTYSPTGKKLKEQGVKAGVPDLHLPIARRGFFGLWIEMKVGENDLSKEQRQWKTALEEEGYAYRVCYSADDAWKVLMWYIAGQPTRTSGVTLK
jgi:hypothetical protein